MTGIIAAATKQVILVADDGTAGQALIQRLQGVISSGEAPAIIINKPNNGTPSSNPSL